MPFIQNISLRDIERGQHLAVDHHKDWLIQIVDSDAPFPKPAQKFNRTLQLSFDDVEEAFAPRGVVGITERQAEDIAHFLLQALKEDRSVIVHCHAGLCRSGAVAQAGEALGFQPGERPQVPNLRVKRLVMEKLGLAFKDEDTQFPGLCGLMMEL